MKKEIKNGLYIPAIEACWLAKEENYIVDNKYKEKMLIGKLDYSYELEENTYLINNIKIEKLKKDKYYTYDIINVKFTKLLKKDDIEISTKELRNKLYIEGFKFEGKKYINWKRSSGKARIGQCLFIREDLFKNSIAWARMNLDFIGNVDIASIRAYESLTLSSIIDTITIPLNSILVINDFESKFNYKMSETKLINGKLITELNENHIEKNSIWDGESLLDVSVFNSNVTTKNKGMTLLRNRLFKSCAFNTNIQQFLKDYYKDKFETAFIEDMFNNKIKVSSIKMITTPNSFKIKKFNKQVLEKGYTGEGAWLKYWKDNASYVFGICKTEKETKNRLAYQHVNSIYTFTKEDIHNLAKNDLQYIQKLKNDLNFFLEEINNKEEIEDIDCIDNVQQMFIELSKKNDKIIQTQIFKDYRRNFINAKINELRQGKITIQGDYMTILGNPIEMLFAAVKQFNGQTIAIKDNEIWCSYFKDKEYLVGFRNPHVCAGNVFNAINTKNDLIDKYINYTKNIIIVNSIKYPILTILEGSDFDSDTLLLTNNETVVNACKKIDFNKTPIPVNCIENTGKNNKELTGKNMASIDHVISQNFIGEDINVSQHLNSLFNHALNNNLKTQEELDRIYSFISQTSSISCVEIDKAKKQFENLDVAKELDKIKKLEFTKVKDVNKDFDNDTRILKPTFFKYVGDTKTKKIRRKNNRKYKKELDNKVLQEYAKKHNIRLEDISKKNKEKKIKNNTKIYENWKERIYINLDTPMNFLQNEIDKIKNNKCISTLQLIQLIKKNKHKSNDEIVTKAINIINDTSNKIKSYINNIELDYYEKKSKIVYDKEKAIEELKELELTQTDIYYICKNCFSTIRKATNKKTKEKYYRIDQKSSIESITLELLFYSYKRKVFKLFL